jgi:hypothetical protein
LRVTTPYEPADTDLMSNRVVLVVFAASFVATAAWAALVACPRPEEDACSSIGSLVAFVATIGSVLGIAVTVVLAVAIKVAQLSRRRRRP